MVGVFQFSFCLTFFSSLLFRNGIQFNFEGIVQQAHEDPIRAMTWSHNDLIMVSADEGGVVKYWQTTMNNVKAFKAHKEPVRDISFAPNDMHFVTCSDDQTASIWDLETSKEVVCLKGHGWDVKAAQWHPTKGIIITGGKDQLIKVWDPRAGGHNSYERNECLADLHAHKNTVNRLAWSPLNPYWFLSGSRDNLVKVFDIRTMKDFQTNRAHKKEITSLTWHPTSERLFASGSHDGVIHHWFVGESETQGEITGAHDSAVYGLQWHPLGHLLASGSNDHTTRFWARNRPGDDLTDKYNVASLPAEQKAIAVSTLVEAAKMNPSKYSRLPASLAEFAQQGQQELAEATAKTAYAEANPQASAEFIPGMGGAGPMAFVPGMGAGANIKRENTPSSNIYSSSQSTVGAYSSEIKLPPQSYDAKPSSYSHSSGSSSSRDRKRSRSRERDSGYSSRPSTSSSSSSSSTIPSSSSSVGGYSAFFPSQPTPQLTQQQRQQQFFPPPPPPPQQQHQQYQQQQGQMRYHQTNTQMPMAQGGYSQAGFPPPPQQHNQYQQHQQQYSSFPPPNPQQQQQQQQRYPMPPPPQQHYQR